MYSYRYFDIVKMHFNIGASGWVVDGAIVYYYDERKPHGVIRVIRPSGKTFIYRLRPDQPSSAAYIISDVIDFLHFIVDASYTRVEVVE